LSNQTKFVIFSDLDGTLLDQNERLHPADAELLKHGYPEVLLAIASGRPMHSIRRTIQALGLYDQEKMPLPVVSLNGAAVYAQGEDLCGVVNFDPFVQEKLVALLQEHRGATIFFQDPDAEYTQWITSFGQQALEQYWFNHRPFSSAKTDHSFCKIMCMSSEPDTLQEICDAVTGAELSVETAYSMPTILEITPKSVNKWDGVSKLVEKLGLYGVKIFAAGDGGNDVSMLKAADCSFAPLTSPPEVRRLANKVIDTTCEGLITPMLREAGLL